MKAPTNSLGIGCAMSILFAPLVACAEPITNLAHSTAITNGIVLQVVIVEDISWINMFMVMSISNGSTANITYHEDGYLAGFRFSACDEAGVAVAFTKKGNQFCGTESLSSFKFSAHQLAPGKVLTAKVKLPEFLAIDKTGAYKMTITWQSDAIDPRKNIRIDLKDIQFAVSNL